MQFIFYLTLLAVLYLGLVAGYVLMLLAPEEKKPGMKYFNSFSYILFAIFIVTVIFFNPTNFFLIGSSAVFFLLLCIFNNYKPEIAYLFFSIVIPFSGPDELISLSTIVFLYGLTAGAVIIDPDDKRRSIARIFFMALFVLIAAGLRLIP